MEANLGRTDRIARIVVGLVFIGLAMADLIGPWGWVGMLPIVSAVLGWCPAYMIIGQCTR